MKYYGDFLPLLTSKDYNKNHAKKKQVYLPDDFWHFLANTGQPSKFIFYAIKEKKERDFPNCKKKEGDLHGDFGNQYEMIAKSLRLKNDSK